ncbi:MAG: hypothetical protein EXR62_11960 [Chloroflexi bacterium]|nr:hypothetical protein [Chloroflexota bacterium]
MTTPEVTAENPYVGLAAFTRDKKHLFFGREREARDLLARVISERLLLFYAQSGAGKTSLINARLILGLEEERFIALPVGRVRGGLPPGVQQVDNLFAFNLMLSLATGEKNPARFANLSLSDFLARLATEDGQEWTYDETLLPGPASQPASKGATDGASTQPFALIIDQFEEIITHHQERWEDREGFFRQLSQALLDDPNLWVILALREDYIAALDPYVHLLPNRLRARFYLERMGGDAALEAIRAPAALAGRPFESGAAEALRDDLLQILVPGTMKTLTGQFVTPMQLQVVCSQVWKKLRQRPGDTITLPDVTELAKVEDALGDFYEKAIATVLETPHIGVAEAALRSWFSEKLITEGGTRSILFRNETSGETAGLPNRAVDLLAAQFLLRTEMRAGGAWVELVHDRLVRPVLAANAAWFQANLSPLQEQAALWDKQNRAQGFLLQDDALAAAEQWVAEHTAELTQVEIVFLAECREARAAAERERRQSARFRWLAVIALIIAGIALVAFVGALYFYQRADALSNKLAAQVSGLSVFKSRQLTAQAINLRNDQADLALLLSLEAIRTSDTSDTSETIGSLLNILKINTQITTFLWGHSSGVNSVAFSPDGKTLASGSADQTIILWDVAKRAVNFPITGYPAPAAQNTVSTTYQSAINFPITGYPAPAVQNTVSTTYQSRVYLDHANLGQVYSVAFSPDGKTLASGSGTIILWDVATGHPLGQLKAERTSPWASVAFSPDGKTLASGSGDGTIILWDVATAQPLGSPLTGHKAGVFSVAFSPDGKTLASGSVDGTVIFWDVAKGQPLGQPPTGHKGYMSSVAFSPDGKTLASGSGDGTVILWDVAKDQLLGSILTGHGNQVRSVAFSPDGKALVSGNGDGTVILWDVATRPPLGSSLTGHKGYVHGVAFSPDGKTLASGSGDGTVILWDMEKRQPLGFPLTGHKGQVRSVAFSPDGKTLASGSCGQVNANGFCQQGEISLWDVVTRQPLGSPLTHHKDIVESVAFSPDGKILASGSCGQVVANGFCQQGEISLWDVATRQPLGSPLTGHKAGVFNVAFSPDGKTLASGGWDGTIILWDVATRQPLGSPLTHHKDIVESVAFSPDGKTLASGNGHGTIILWDVATRQPLGSPLTGHKGGVFSVAFSPDGKTLASGSLDQTIILWDVATATREPFILLLTGHKNYVLSLAFSPDSNTLASGSGDNTVILWDVSLESWQSRACGIANRNLTQEEWQKYTGDEPYRKTCPDLPAG